HAVRIDAGEQIRRQLDYRELTAESLVHHAELEPDHAAANDDEPLGNLAQAHRFTRADDVLAIELEARHLNGGRPRGHHDGLACGQTTRAATLQAHFDGIAGHEPSAPLDDLHAVRFEQSAY